MDLKVKIGMYRKAMLEIVSKPNHDISHEISHEISLLAKVETKADHKNNAGAQGRDNV